MNEANPQEIVRKRPKQARAKSTVDSILAAATQILTDEGEDRLNTNAIARRAGFSIGTLYQYFPDKEAILVELIVRQRAEMEQRIVSLIESRPEEPAEETARRIVHLLVGLFRSGRQARKSLFTVMLRLFATQSLPQNLSPVSYYIIIAWRKARGDNLAPLSDADAFVLTRAVRGVLRQAVMEDSPLLDTPEFEEALALLVISFMQRAEQKASPP